MKHYYALINNVLQLHDIFAQSLHPLYFHPSEVKFMFVLHVGSWMTVYRVSFSFLRSAELLKWNIDIDRVFVGI